MTREDILELKAGHAQEGSSFKLHSTQIVSTPYPKRRGNISDSRPSSVFYAAFLDRADSTKSFLATLVYSEGEYELRCGDLYLEGRISVAARNKMIATAAKEAFADQQEALKKRLFKSYNSLPKCVHCDAIGARKGIVCTHEAHLLSLVDHNKLDEIERFERKMVDQPVVGTPNNLDSTFNRYAFKKHLLLEGDKGSGKTWYVQQWCKRNGVNMLFVGGHEQFESMDFLGHYIKTDSGDLVWKDGALSEAFRSAASGRKSVLIVDEMLRIPRRELNILISTLSPTAGVYTLRTGRAVKSGNGLAKEEVLQAPQDELWVLGTTNVGDGYAVDTIDDALLDRFKPFRKETTEEELRTVLTITAKGRGFTQASVDSLLRFYQKMGDLKASGILTKIVNLRHLNEVLLYAEEEKSIPSHVQDSMLLWVDRLGSGHPDQAQAGAVDKLIRAIWNTPDPDAL